MTHDRAHEPFVGKRPHTLTTRRPVIVRRRVVAALVAGLLLSACAPQIVDTPPPLDLLVEEPAEPALTGARVAVVLPPADVWHPDLIDEMRRDLRVVEATSQDSITELRIFTADTDVFVADLIGYLAAQRFDLTCALTTGTSSMMRQQHAERIQQRFCALVTSELSTDEADGFDVMVLRTAELGYVMGVAAATASNGAVGTVLATHDLERGRFRDGLTAALAPVEVIATPSEVAGVDAIAEIIEAGADVVVIGSGPWALETAQAAIDAGLQVVVPAVIGRQLEQQSAIVATWRIQWQRVLRGPVDRLLGRDPAVELSQGVAEGVLVVDLGASAPAQTASAVTAVLDRLAAGEIDPMAARAPEFRDMAGMGFDDGID